MDGSHIVNGRRKKVNISCYCSTSRTVHHVCECHILSVNFIGQQQDKSCDVKETFSQIGFVDGFFRRLKLEPKKLGALAGY